MQITDAEIELLDKLVSETETIDDQEEVFRVDLRFDCVQIDLKDSTKDKTLLLKQRIWYYSP